MTDAELEEKLRANLLPENLVLDDSSPGKTVEDVIRLADVLDQRQNGALQVVYSLGQTISAVYDAWMPVDRKKKAFNRWHAQNTVIKDRFVYNYARFFVSFYDLAVKYPQIKRLKMSIHEFRKQQKSIEYALDCNKNFWSQK